jgi:hypothetical protein
MFITEKETPSPDKNMKASKPKNISSFLDKR